MRVRRGDVDVLVSFNGLVEGHLRTLEVWGQFADVDVADFGDAVAVEFGVINVLVGKGFILRYRWEVLLSCMFGAFVSDVSHCSVWVG